VDGRPGIDTRFPRGPQITSHERDVKMATRCVHTLHMLSFSASGGQKTNPFGMTASSAGLALALKSCAISIMGTLVNLIN
jgi:hypothetical protein